MRAAVLERTEHIEVLERDYPTLAPADVLVRVRACGLCGTDQHIYHGLPGSATVEPPRILGHEIAGEIVALGATAGVAGFAIGDRVTVDPNIYCSMCRYCQSGRYHLCDHLQAVGVTRDGGMAEYCVVPAGNCYHLPDGLSFEDGALIEPLGCVLHGIKQLEFRAGATILVVGGGFIGQLMVQLAGSHAPGHLVVSEPDARKRERVLELGAHLAVDPTERSTAEILALLGGGADIVIECVGRPQTMELAIRAANKGGQVLLFGVAAPDATIPVAPYEIFRKELVIRGSFINPATHAESISLATQRIVQLSPLVSHRWTLEEIPEIMRRYAQLGVTKGLVVVAGEGNADGLP